VDDQEEGIEKVKITISMHSVLKYWHIWSAIVTATVAAIVYAIVWCANMTFDVRQLKNDVHEIKQYVVPRRGYTEDPQQSSNKKLPQISDIPQEYTGGK